MERKNNYKNRIKNLDNCTDNKPRFSVIDICNDDIVYENYDKLDDYLLKYIVPNKIRKILDKTTGEEISYIQLNTLVELNLNELELKHAVLFLKSLNIKVRGRDSILLDECDNFDSLISFRKSNPKTKVLSKDELNKLFKELRNTNDSEIRNKIFEHNMNLSIFVLDKLPFIEFNDDSIQVAYEGLLKAIDGYDPYKDISFSSYAYESIRKHLLSHYTELRYSFGGNGNNGWQLSYAKCKHIVELEYGSIRDNLDLIDKVIDLMIEDKTVSEVFRTVTKDRIKLYFYSDSVEDYLENNEYIPDSYSGDRPLENSYNTNDLDSGIDLALSYLNKNERDIIKLRFGIDCKPVSIDNIASMYNLNKSTIYSYIRTGLRKLRRPNKIKILEKYR